MPTAFTSSSWDVRDQWDADTEVGEVRQSVEWTRPAPLNGRYTGQAPCGSPDILAGGATEADVGTPLVDDQGVPECCNALEWVGGSCGGGNALSWPLYPWPPAGNTLGASVQATLSVLPGDPPVSGLPLVFRLRRQFPFALYEGLSGVFPSTLRLTVVIVAPGVLTGYQVYQDGDPIPPLVQVGYAPPPVILAAAVLLPQLSPLPLQLVVQENGPPEGWSVTPVVQVNFESQAQATVLRGRMTDDGFGVPYSLGLYVGDQLLPATLTLPGITQATFPGYAEIPLSGTWVQTLTQGRIYLLQHPEVIFTCTGGVGEVIGGWFIKSVTGVDRLRFIRRFGSGPVLMANAGQEIRVIPAVTVQSQYSD